MWPSQSFDVDFRPLNFEVALKSAILYRWGKKAHLSNTEARLRCLHHLGSQIQIIVLLYGIENGYLNLRDP